MTARLFVKENGSTRFEPHKGDFTTAELATQEGENLCFHGNVESFEVWTKFGTFRKATVIEAVVEGERSE